MLDLLQALRRRRRPVPAHELAAELGISVRTLYRDVAALVGEGAPIEGEAGVGYVLKAGFTLPPLMFDPDELDALALGLRLVVARADPDLAIAAENAMAKIVAVLPPDRDTAIAGSGLLAGPMAGSATPILAALRSAMRAERKIHLHYSDKGGVTSERTIWPVAIGFFNSAEVLIGWCELRTDFRHFRLDRIGSAQLLDEKLPTRRRILLAQWRLQQNVTADTI